MPQGAPRPLRAFVPKKIVESDLRLLPAAQMAISQANHLNCGDKDQATVKNILGPALMSPMRSTRLSCAGFELLSAPRLVVSRSHHDDARAARKQRSGRARGLLISAASAR